MIETAVNFFLFNFHFSFYSTTATNMDIFGYTTKTVMTYIKNACFHISRLS